MSTYTLGENITSTAKTDAQPVEAGIYMVAASAEGTIVNLQFFMNIGAATDVQLFSEPLSMDSTKIIVLPDCAVSVSVGNLGRIGGANVALTRMGDVTGYIQPDEVVAIPPIDGPVDVA